MELTENLRKEFISSFQRLTISINNAIDNEYYDYQQIYEIYKTYIEYCKAFNSIDCFSDVPLNTKIKFPKRLIKSNWAGKATEKEFLLFGKYTRRDYFFEKKVKEMFEEMKPNLQLINLYLKNDFNSNEKYANDLIEIINNQPKIYKRKVRKENSIKYILTIFCFILIFIFVFVGTDLKFLFKNTEIGHVFSYVINLNDFDFSISEDQKKSCSIEWNENVIYKNGKINQKNINDARYLYGENCIKIYTENFTKIYYFYKYNNWDYYIFKINVYNDDCSFWIDGKIQDELEKDKEIKSHE